MIRIVLFLISLPLLAFILSPFTQFILEMRGSVAYTLGTTAGMLNWLGITAIFSALALSTVEFFYKFFK